MHACWAALCLLASFTIASCMPLPFQGARPLLAALALAPCMRAGQLFASLLLLASFTIASCMPLPFQGARPLLAALALAPCMRAGQLFASLLLAHLLHACHCLFRVLGPSWPRSLLLHACMLGSSLPPCFFHNCFMHAIAFSGCSGPLGRARSCSMHACWAALFLLASFTIASCMPLPFQGARPLLAALALAPCMRAGQLFASLLLSQLLHACHCLFRVLGPDWPRSLLLHACVLGSSLPPCFFHNCFMHAIAFSGCSAPLGHARSCSMHACWAALCLLASPCFFHNCFMHAIAFSGCSAPLGRARSCSMHACWAALCLLASFTIASCMPLPFQGARPLLAALALAPCIRAGQLFASLLLSQLLHACHCLFRVLGPSWPRSLLLHACVLGSSLPPCFFHNCFMHAIAFSGCSGRLGRARSCSMHACWATLHLLCTCLKPCPC